MDAPNLLNIAETSARTRTPEATLRFWRYQGVGPKSFKVGRRVMYKRADVDRWLEEQYNNQPLRT
jgi:predicted DNA-binding transcriptional regulator AlpA